MLPTSLGWMRSASRGVSPMIHAIVTSDKELWDALVDGAVESGRNLAWQ